MKRSILFLLMLVAVSTASAHDEHRWSAWLSAGQNDADFTAQRTIPQATLLTSFGDFGKVDTPTLGEYEIRLYGDESYYLTGYIVL